MKLSRLELLVASMNDRKLLERFESKIIKRADGCWEMDTHHDKDGYPLIWFHDNNVRGSQVSMVLYKKEDVIDKIICHVCDNVKYINPDHLILATNRYNTRDMLRKKRGGMQKITEEQVIEIYKKSLEGRPNKALAEEYAISASTVCNILKGRNWEWLYGRYLELRSEYRVEKLKA